MSSPDQRPARVGLNPSPLCAADHAQVRTVWINFYDVHYDRVVRFLMHAGASLQDAQDAAQEAFAESWRLIDAEPAWWASVASKEAWFRTVALRKYRRPPGSRIRPQLADGAAIPEMPDPGPGPAESAELTARTRAVLQSLHSLDEEERMVMAFFLDGFSAKQTAAALDKTEDRVSYMRQKARAALKIALAGWADPEGAKHDER